jgi:hypothetical protein
MRALTAALVPRTRSSHILAASPIANFGFKRGTRIVDLLVSLGSRSSPEGVPQMLANFGIGTLAAAALAAGPTAASAATKMSPAEVQATFFTGQPFTASTPSNIKFTMVFKPDGKVTREPQGKSGVKGEGTWKLSKDGFCTTWKGSKANCFTLVSIGDNKWSVVKGAASVATWNK